MRLQSRTSPLRGWQRSAGASRVEPEPAGGSATLCAAAMVWIGVVVYPTDVWGQDKESSPLEEVIVTAQKRTESLQKVPEAVTAIDGKLLEEMGAKNFIDYALNAPSLSFGFSTLEGRGTKDQISIRGISGGNTTGTYVDETAVPTGLGLRLVDVERVEILRGPQGTLYGSGSMGGLVKVVTRRPDTQAFAGAATAVLGRVDGGSDTDLSGEMTLNLPLSPDRAGARLVAYYTRESGFIDRVFGQPLPYAPEVPTAELPKGVHKDVNSQQVYGARLSTVFQLGGGWEISPVFHWEHRQEDGVTDTDLNDRNRGTQFRSYNINEPFKETDQVAQLAVTYTSDRLQFVSSTSYWDRDMEEHEDDTEAFDEFFRAGYLDPTVPAYPSVIANFWTQQSLQQELRFSGLMGEKLNWLLGGYYQDGEGLRKIRYSMPGWSANARYNNPGFGDRLFDCNCGSKSKDQAVFGSLTYALTDQLNLTVGQRYFKYTTKGFGLEEGIFAAGIPFTNRIDETGTTPRVSIDYTPRESLLLYATASKGFRPGAGGSPLPPQCFPEATNLGVSSAGFKSDKTLNYELGVKSKIGGRAIVNASVFQVDWTQLQQTIRLLSCGFTRTSNIGEARIRGVELEANFLATDRVEIGASIGYMDPKITDPGVNTRSESGDRPLNVAKWNAAARIRYDFALGSGKSGFARADYQYLADSFTTFNQDEPVPITEQQAYERRPPYHNVNARIGFKPTENLEVSLFGDNLTDEEANFGDIAPIGIGHSRRTRFVTNRPRLFGVEFSFDF